MLILKTLARAGEMLSLLGLAFGLPLTLVYGRMLASLLFGVKAGDPIVLLSVLGTLACVSAVAYLALTRARSATAQHTTNDR
jgi:hypothetical protein